MVLGILGSGSGSNMQAILDAIDVGTLEATIGLWHRAWNGKSRTYYGIAMT